MTVLLLYNHFLLVLLIEFLLVLVRIFLVHLASISSSIITDNDLMFRFHIQLLRLLLSNDVLTISVTILFVSPESIVSVSDTVLRLHFGFTLSIICCICLSLVCSCIAFRLLSS